NYSFSAMAGFNSQMLRCPVSDLILYDSSEILLSSTDFEKIYDTNGNEVVTELKGFYNMTLYQVLTEIFTRCGFSGVQCNIGDYGLTRVDFKAGQPYIEV